MRGVCISAFYYYYSTYYYSSYCCCSCCCWCCFNFSMLLQQNNYFLLVWCIHLFTCAKIIRDLCNMNRWKDHLFHFIYDTITYVYFSFFSDFLSVTCHGFFSLCFLHFSHAIKEERTSIHTCKQWSQSASCCAHSCEDNFK